MKHLVGWITFSIISLFSMELPNTTSSFLKLPSELKIVILKQIVKDDFQNNTHYLLSLQNSCKSMQRLINQQSIPLIAYLTPLALKKIYLYKNKLDFATIKVAIFLGTSDACAFLKQYISDSKDAYFACKQLSACYLDCYRLTTSAKIFNLKMLMGAGFSLNHINCIKGESPIMRAIHQANPKLVQFFLETNLDVTKTDEDGATVMDIWNREYRKAYAKKDKKNEHNLKIIKKMIDERKSEQKKEDCNLS